MFFRTKQMVASHQKVVNTFLVNKSFLTIFLIKCSCMMVGVTLLVGFCVSIPKASKHLLGKR